jgi:hypothetical protein
MRVLISRAAANGSAPMTRRKDKGREASAPPGPGRKPAPYVLRLTFGPGSCGILP